MTLQLWYYYYIKRGSFEDWQMKGDWPFFFNIFVSEFLAFICPPSSSQLAKYILKFLPDKCCLMFRCHFWIWWRDARWLVVGFFSGFPTSIIHCQTGVNLKISAHLSHQVFSWVIWNNFQPLDQFLAVQISQDLTLKKVFDYF